MAGCVRTLQPQGYVVDMNIWTDRRTDRRTDRWTNSRTESEPERRTEQKDGQSNRQTDKQKNGERDGQEDVQSIWCGCPCAGRGASYVEMCFECVMCKTVDKHEPPNAWVDGDHKQKQDVVWFKFEDCAGSIILDHRLTVAVDVLIYHAQLMFREFPLSCDQFADIALPLTQSGTPTKSRRL